MRCAVASNVLVRTAAGEEIEISGLDTSNQLVFDMAIHGSAFGLTYDHPAEPTSRTCTAAGERINMNCTFDFE